MTLISQRAPTLLNLSFQIMYSFLIIVMLIAIMQMISMDIIIIFIIISIWIDLFALMEINHLVNVLYI